MHFQWAIVEIWTGIFVSIKYMFIGPIKTQTHTHTFTHIAVVWTEHWQSISIVNITHAIRNNQRCSPSVLCWIIRINCDFRRNHSDEQFVRISVRSYNPETMCVVSHRPVVRDKHTKKIGDHNDDDATGINLAWDEPNGDGRRQRTTFVGFARTSRDSMAVIVVGSQSYTIFKVILTLAVCGFGSSFDNHRMPSDTLL